MLRTFVITLGVTAALLAGPGASAETLQDAFRDAVAHSPELAAQRARIEAQRQAVPLALSEALPQIELSATASRIWSDDPSFRARGSEDNDEWRGSANGSQLLFGSGRVWSRYRQAKAQVGAAEALYAEARQSLLLATATAYADVIRAREFLKANEKTLSNLEEQRRYVQANQRAGFLTATDLAQADARIAAARSDIARANADIVTASRSFERLVGRPPTTLAALDPVGGLPASEDEAVASGRGKRQLVEAARLSEKAAESGIDAAEAAGRPRLTFEASSAIENDFGGVGADRFIDDVVGLRLVVPLSAGGANWARTRQQRALRTAARHEVTITLEDLEREVSVAWAELGAARAAAEASGEEVRAATVALRGIRREQENGLRSIIDVLDQEQALLEAELARVAAARDVAVGEYRLLFATGGLGCSDCRK